MRTADICTRTADVLREHPGLACIGYDALAVAGGDRPLAWRERSSSGYAYRYGYECIGALLAAQRGGGGQVGGQVAIQMVVRIDTLLERALELRRVRRGVQGDPLAAVALLGEIREHGEKAARQQHHHCRRMSANVSEVRKFHRNREHRTVVPAGPAAFLKARPCKGVVELRARCSFFGQEWPAMFASKRQGRSSSRGASRIGIRSPPCL